MIPHSGNPAADISAGVGVVVARVCTAQWFSGGPPCMKGELLGSGINPVTAVRLWPLIMGRSNGSRRGARLVMWNLTITAPTGRGELLRRGWL
jgi:hypothetical protein